MSLSRYACLTDTGRVREHNEDAYACVCEKGLWVVADGMGGHEAGELASAIVTSHVIQQVQSGATPAEALESAHQAILDAADRGEGSPRRGCTPVFFYMREHHLALILSKPATVKASHCPFSWSEVCFIKYKAT